MLYSDSSFSSTVTLNSCFESAKGIRKNILTPTGSGLLVAEPVSSSVYKQMLTRWWLNPVELSKSQD